jgi:hypothetical protein
VRLGVGPLNLGTVNLTAASRAVVSAAEKAAPGLQANTNPARLLRNSLKDIGTLGKAPFIGGYGAGSAIVSDLSHLAAHPTALAHGYDSKSGKFLSGILGGAVEEAKHPGKSISEHPILTLLDAAGVATVAGRTAGAAGRRMGRSSTVRPALAMTDDAGQPAVVQRTYSKDEIRRQVQKHEDSKREPLRDAKGNVVTVKDRGRDVPVLKSTAAEKERFARQRGDFIASRGNLTERQARDRQTKESRVHGVKGRAAKDIVAMAVEGTLRSAKTFAADLKAERVRIAKRIAAHEDGSQPFRDKGDLQAATDRFKLVDRVLRNPKAMAQGPRIVAEAERHGRKLNAGDVASAEAKIIDPLAARRSALSVTALQHMGARHFTAEEHAALERDAAKAERAAADVYVTAKTPAAKKAALDDLNAAREHRIAVSGREPEGVRKHENARARHAAARSRSKAAHDAEEKAKQRVSNLAAQHRSERGREAHHGPVASYHIGEKRFVLLKDAAAYAKAHGVPVREIKRVAKTAGEAKRVGDLSKARRALKAATDRRRVADRAVKVAERGMKENPLPEARAALRYGENNPAGKPAGAYLSNADIEDFLRASGRDPETVAYLPHRQNVRGSRAHHAQMRPGQRPLLDSGETRTGKAYLDAITESSASILHDQGVRQAVQLNKAKQLDKLVEDHGLRHPAWAKAQRGEQLTRVSSVSSTRAACSPRTRPPEFWRGARSTTRASGSRRCVPTRRSWTRRRSGHPRGLAGPGGMDDAGAAAAERPDRQAG